MVNERTGEMAYGVASNLSDWLAECVVHRIHLGMSLRRARSDTPHQRYFALKESGRVAWTGWTK